MMTFLLWLAGFIDFTPTGSPPPTSRTYLHHHWYEELALYGGSLILALLLGLGMIGTTYAGQYLGGHYGRELGLDLGLSLSVFAGTGALIHLVRYFIIRVYLRIKLETWSGEEAVLYGPIPGTTLRRFIVSTNWDFLAQFVAAIVILGFALWVAP